MIAQFGERWSYPKGVIARLDRAIQYPEAGVRELALTTSAAAYWMPRSSRGMTAERCGA